MDCEKFDQHVIEALYDELDELTYASLKRHVEGCSRCAAERDRAAAGEVAWQARVLPVSKSPSLCGVISRLR